MHNFLKFQAEISWRQSPYNFKVLGSRTGYKAMSQTLYTFERGKADLLEGDAHGRVLKKCRDLFFNVIAQNQVQENSITTCAWSSLGTRFSTVKIFLNLKTMNRWKLSLNGDKDNYPTLEKAYFFLYTDPFLCHWSVIYYKEIQASTFVLTGCENTSRFG